MCNALWESSCRNAPLCFTASFHYQGSPCPPSGVAVSSGVFLSSAEQPPPPPHRLPPPQMASAEPAATDAVVLSLTPLLATYQHSVGGVLAGQASLEGKLTSLLAALKEAQGLHSEGGSAQMREYAGRVEALRHRLDGVAGVMGRVQGRLERLQATVTKVEIRDLEAQRSGAAAAAAAAAAATAAAEGSAAGKQ